MRRNQRPARLRKIFLGGAWRAGRLGGESLEQRCVLAGDLAITEFMAANSSGLTDADGEAVDWIELQNQSDQAIQLSGYALSDDPNEPAKWRFPERELAAGEYLIVFASGKNGPDGEQNLHTNFRLSADGEYLALSNPAGVVLAEYAPAYPPQTANVSYGWGQTEQRHVLTEETTAARYWVPSFLDGPALEERWMSSTFDDSGWTAGSASLGYDSRMASESVNLAPLGTASQSSTGFGGLASRAVDGLFDTFSHTLNQPDSWWRWELPASRQLGRIVLWNRIDCCAERLSNFRVTVSDDSGQAVFSQDYFPLAGEGGFVPQADSLEILLPPATWGRALEVRLVGENREGNGYLTLAEVEVYEAVGFRALIDTDVSAAMQGANTTLYARIPFTYDPAQADGEKLRLTVQYDDGFVAYLNGQELTRRNAPAALTWAAIAASDRPDIAVKTPEAIDVPLPPGLLRDGDNLLALQGLNDAFHSPEFLLRTRLELIGGTETELAFFPEPTPGAANREGVQGFIAPPTFSAERGIYTQPLTTVIRSSLAGGTLVVTTDGSLPTLTNGRQVVPRDDGEVVALELPVDTNVTVRAVVFREGWLPSSAETHSYLFPAVVLRQPVLPDGMPAVWDGRSESPIPADYEMDPEVVNDPVYAADALAGLTSIPTLSLVMDPADLFGSQRGIYIHSGERGEAWERPTSLEIIQPDGTNFQTNSGIRIHGYSWRFHANSPKHSFRLEFRDQYGPSKLEYPLFPDAPVDRFDSIVLRAQGGRAWAGQQEPQQAQYIRDVFARDTARDMGKIDGHAAYFHLYLNGLYWGLYHAVERPDAQMAEEYFGGDDVDYDALNRRTTTNEAIDGDLQRYNEMIALANRGLESPEAYAEMQRYVDIDNLIDFFLIHQYMTNRDGPETFDSNNQRAIGSRIGDPMFRFFVWDMEYSMWNASDNINIDVDVPTSASRVFTALRENAEFRLRYADRVQKHLMDDGALTPAKAAARWQARADEIYQAIVDESARWGDAKRTRPYTRDVEWQRELNRLMTQYFPQRTQILIDQLREAGLYPRIVAPQWSQRGGYVLPETPISLTAEEGQIYYTIDGSDPRDPLPALSPISLIAPGSEWRYLDDGSDQGLAWVTPEFDDQAWKQGRAELGYGDGDEATVVNCGPTAPLCTSGNFITTYFRREFTSADNTGIESLTLRLRRDDGAVVYVNGQEVARSNLPNGAIDYRTPALRTGSETVWQVFKLDVRLLQTGSNLLAVEIHQRNSTDNDISMDVELIANPGPLGTPSASAIRYQGPISWPRDTVVRARVMTPAGTWSALTEGTFLVGVPATGESLRVTEIHYHPQRASGLEFVELQNVSQQTIDLGAVQFDQGIAFDFAQSDVKSLAPGEHLVVVRDRDAFVHFYSDQMLIAGEYTGRLDDAGELLRLRDAAGVVLLEFAFDDQAPWPELADGGGYSLTIVDPQADISQPTNWQASRMVEGTPGAADWIVGDANLDGQFDSRDLVLIFQAGKYEDSVASFTSWADGDWNRDGRFTSTDLVFAFQVGSYLAAAQPGSILRRPTR